MTTNEEVIHIRNKAQADLSSKVELPSFYLNDEVLEQLQEFCQTFDPYTELDLETRLKLQEFGVKDHSNPFDLTNKLLMLLENNLQWRLKNQA